MKNEQIILWIVGIAVLLFLFGGFGMMGYGGFGSWMGNMMYGYAYSGMWIFGWLFMILVAVALVLLIMWLIKQLQK